MNKLHLLNESKYLALIVGLIGVFFFHWFIPKLQIPATYEIGVSDIWEFNYPMLEEYQHSLRQGKLPLWNILIGNGYPQHASGQTGALHWLTIVYLYFLPAPYAFNLLIVSAFLLVGIGTYLLSRELGLHPLASLFTSVTFTFSGFMVSHISHLVMLLPTAYLPWILWCLLRSIHKGGAYWIALALLISQQLFSGHFQIAFITYGALGILVIYLHIIKRITYYQIITLCIVLILGIVASSAQLLPTLELVKTSNRETGLKTDELLRYAYPPKYLLTLINPYIWGDPNNGTFTHFNENGGALFWEVNGFIGIIPLLLAAATIFRRRKTALPWMMMLGTSVLLMFGKHSPTYLLLLYPPFSFFRFPNRFLLTFILALVILSGLAINQLVSAKTKQAFILAGMLLLLNTVHVLSFWYTYHTLIPYDTFLKAPEVLKSLSKNDDLIYTFEKHARAYKEFFTKASSSKTAHYIDLRNELVPNLNMVYKIPTIDAYEAIYPKRLGIINTVLSSSYDISTVQSEIEPFRMNIIKSKGATVLLAPYPLKNNQLEQMTIFNSLQSEPLYIYRVKDPIARYTLYTQWVVGNTLEDFSSTFIQPDFNPNKEIFIEEPFPISSTSPVTQNVEIRFSTNTNKLLHINTDQSAILAIAQTFYPGWKAILDGNPTSLFPVNIANTGVFIPSGSHDLSLEYAPDSLMWGVRISFICYVFFILYGLYLLGRDRKNPSVLKLVEGRLIHLGFFLIYTLILRSFSWITLTVSINK